MGGRSVSINFCPNSRLNPPAFVKFLGSVLAMTGRRARRRRVGKRPMTPQSPQRRWGAVRDVPTPLVSLDAAAVVVGGRVLVHTKVRGGDRRERGGREERGAG